MPDTWKSKWDERYSDEQYAYGEQPNNYFAAQIEKLSPGRILLPAEGEGRNAVYAAKLGWKVDAFDISEEGRKKAIHLAAQNGVDINYQVGELSVLGYPTGQLDAIALIYAHFPALLKSDIHRELNKLLRSGGTIIFEAFSKKHLEYLARDERVGGPKDIGSLFSIEEIKQDFSGYNLIELNETEISLNEGIFHKGLGSVIRFTAKKQ